MKHTYLIRQDNIAKQSEIVVLNENFVETSKSWIINGSMAKLKTNCMQILIAISIDR